MSVNITSDLLCTLKNGFSDEGSSFIPPIFDVLAEVTKFLELLPKQPHHKVCEVAIIASLLRTKKAKACILSKKLDIDLLPNLEVEGFLTLLELNLHIAKGFNHAVVGSAIIIAWYANALRQKDKQRAESIKNSINTAHCSSKDIKDVIDQVNISISYLESLNEPFKKKEDSELFSVSIDLAGATQAKSDTLNIIKEEPNRIDEINLEIMREFQDAEINFYSAACSKYNMGEKVDPFKIFAVKGIGDEVWSLISPSHDKTQATGLSLINAGIQAACKTITPVVTENSDNNQFDPHFNYGKTKRLALGVKIYLDIIKEATDIGSFRVESLQQGIFHILKENSDKEPTEKEATEMLNNLIFGHNEPAGWFAYNRIRTDFIGHEVDRFFRATKAAIPGVVVIGESMADTLELKFKAFGTNCNLFSVLKSDGSPFKAGLPLDNIYAIKTKLEKGDMKGIEYAYSTYALFAPRSLNALLKQENADNENQFNTFSFKEIRNLLPDDTLQGLVDIEVMKN